MLKTILVVDDESISRELLLNTLNNDFMILMASNGQEALSILSNTSLVVSAILLDLKMPEMNGFEVLCEIKAKDELNQIPIIVVTSDDDKTTLYKTLELGVVSYIEKPFDPVLVRYTVRNIIHLSESVGNNRLRIDELTGMYKRTAFLEKLKEMVALKEKGYYTLSCFDIEKFKVINDLYGTQKGDEILQYIGKNFDKVIREIGGISCRVSGDNYAFLYPTKFSSSKEIEDIRRIVSNIKGLIDPLVFSIGRYVINENEDIVPSSMYDKAMIAKLTIKGRFDKHIATYDDSMMEYIKLEQKVVRRMETALEQNQFEVWYQPQFNHETGFLVGSEALVRWRHPEDGLISPTVFIPIFEKNGFVYEVDKYVWEQSCKFVKEQIQKGIKMVPVSVNISRYDIFRSDLVSIIQGLVQKYDIPSNMLRLEITESAFAQSSERVVQIVEELKKSGFTVEIDDFGSGYSSLNTLKDVPADVLKLDMKFLQGEDASNKAGSIVESIIRMARWIGMSVIAEGVETVRQANFLKSVGCNYIQGYLYSRPIPQEEFEELLISNLKKEEMIVLEKVETFNIDSFWNIESMDTFLFNSLVGGACICEFWSDKFSVVRINEKATQIIGNSKLTESEILTMDVLSFLSEADVQKLHMGFKRIVSLNETCIDTIEILRSGGKEKSSFVKVMYRLMAKTTNRYLIYVLLEDITEQVELQKAQKYLLVKLKAILDNMLEGVSVYSLKPDGDVNIEFANEKYYSQRGYTKNQYDMEVKSIFDLIHKDDKERALREFKEVFNSARPLTTTYRIITRTGVEKKIRIQLSNIYLSEFQKNVQISITNEIETN